MKEIIYNSRYCTGCSACSQACPSKAVTMEADDEGFLFPLIDENLCNDCDLCKRICPVNKAFFSKHGIVTDEDGSSVFIAGKEGLLSASADKDVSSIEGKGRLSSASAGNDGTSSLSAGNGENPHTFTGKRAFACYSTNDETRGKSSSGGIFSELAVKTLENGGVVFGAAFDSDFSVRHRFVDSIDSLDDLRRSKYVQSDIGDTFIKAKEFLDEGREVLFCGTPCQIAGLKSFLRKNYTNLCACDLACFGVPSPKVWEMYTDFLKDRHQSGIRSISFRDKSGGWKEYHMRISFTNGDEYLVKAKDELYFIGFGKNIFNRRACFDCRFRVQNSGADITLADFWGIDKMNIEVNDDNRGVSLAITHSKTGEVAMARIGDFAALSECDAGEAVKYNPRLVSSAAEPAGRAAFFADMKNGFDFDRLRRKHMDNFSMKYKLKRMIKKVLGRG